ncbi:aldehyde dehydrogenase family protein, partial [Candidatus Hakubella thermalkaliphila]
SIQEARNLAVKARAAQRLYSTFTQEEVDRIVEAMAKAGSKHSERLAKMAVEETGYGVYEHKVIKNKFATETIYQFVKDLKTVGIVWRDPERKVIGLAEPMGVIAGITPVTNPTSTVMFKALIALKSRNAIVFAPHPRAVKCSAEAAKVMEEAAFSAGAPEGMVSCIAHISLEGTEALMKHPDVHLILATGGVAMVRTAYSAGKPAYGVGPGNVPAYVDASADVKKAAREIVPSKTFANGT